MTKISGLVNPDVYNYNRNDKDPDWLLIFLLVSLCFIAWLVGKYIISPILISLGPIGFFIGGIVLLWLVYDLIKDIIHTIKNWFNDKFNKDEFNDKLDN